ncbi:hypothetical protein BBF96_13835 [Anoxybacter fermentans]|uniref:N-acetyltransferase domain-containing protein n=1 Tax=Anoxybacter fermentans TaxID=1323375 RepID=A0A3Q9HSP8_9FIRM|nr:GNAT family N-acetyltransferase [Anoxybacter fermentans]AZR74372.1 hypothetical protein BBF96_13835 [Anoxybacter fermentans]
MINIKKMIECENNFPKNFTNVVERPYGKLFYNENNPQSHDSNHAIILNLAGDLEKAVEDIIIFYEKRGLIPRIYQAYQQGEKDVLFPVLEVKGFKYEEWDNPFFFHEKESKICPNDELYIKRVYQIDSGIIDIIYSEDAGNWTVKVLEYCVQSEDFHLLVGYVAGKPVTMISLEIMDGFSRVDHMLTHKDYRGNGYGRTIVDHLVNYHSAISKNHLYLYAHNPTAIRMYIDAGFVEKKLNLQSWSAWKE